MRNTGSKKGPECRELMEAAQEVYLREFALQTCVNMIANAVSKCEFKTFIRGSPVKGNEHYLWNIEPNINQNSSEFLHKLIDQLVRKNEALAIATRHRNGTEMLVVADDWLPGQHYPAKMNTYTQVQVGDLVYDKTFYENEVLHFKLHAQDTNRAMAELYKSYAKLLATAQENYSWTNGKHVKVHVNNVASGADNFTDVFRENIERQVKPFLQSNMAVLPEFDGYTYTDFGDKSEAKSTTRDIHDMIVDVFDFTAWACGIPPVLITGSVADSKDAITRWLTTCIDPLCDLLQEEINRKRYGKKEYQEGTYLQIDTSTILHYDVFADAANVEKLIGSGVYSINDVLRAAGQAPINATWAEEHWMTLNIGTMGEVAERQKGGRT